MTKKAAAPSPAPKKRKSTPKLPADDGQGRTAHFPIAGIGASAGGLEALEQFFSCVPKETRTGGWYLVRIMPYRTLDNRIDGVVITCSDISAAKKIEAGLQQEIARLEQRLAGQ